MKRIALLLIAALMALPAQAAVLITALETGPNVVFSYSGTLDTNSMVIGATINKSLSGVNGITSHFQAMDGEAFAYVGGVAWAPFGTMLLKQGTTSGTSFAFSGGVLLDSAYVSVSLFSGTLTVAGSFASLGLIQGSYVGFAPSRESVTLNIGAVPLPAGLGLLGSGLAGFALMRRRRV